jgi:hypothetical protein
VGYPTTAELIAASSVVELTGLETPQQDDLRASAIESIESFCHQAFTAEGTDGDPVDRSFDGTASDVLYLPRRLASLATVTLDGTAIFPGVSPVWGWTVEPSREGDRLAFVMPSGSSSWLVRVRMNPGDPRPTFLGGRDNVVVSGVWGWTEAEWTAGELDAVGVALRYAMEDEAQADANPLASTIRSARALGVGSIQQGGLSATISGEPGLSTRAQRKLLGVAPTSGSKLRWAPPIAATA